MKSQGNVDAGRPEVVRHPAARRHVERLPPAARRVVVVGPGVDDGVRDVIVGEIETVGLAEGELEDFHSRKAGRPEEPPDVLVDRAEVLRDDRLVAERAVNRAEKGVAGSRDPSPVQRRRLPGLHLPVGGEAPEVVDPDHVGDPEVVAKALDPPVEALRGETSHR